MDSKELRGLYEAYCEVYQEIDEASKNDTRIRDNISRFSGKKVEYTPPSNWSQSENRGKGATISPKQSEKRRRKSLASEELDIFDTVLEFLYVEGYVETLEDAEWMMSNIIDEEAIGIIAELTGGKGHPGYKAGSKDHGPMETGHPADSEKRKDKGGTMSMRHGYHLGDMDDKDDDDDDDDDDLESVVKQQSRDSRSSVRKPLRSKVKAARKVLSKESFELWLDEAMSSYDKARKQAARRAEDRNRQREEGTLGGRMERISLRDKFGDAAGTRMGKAKPPGAGEKY